MRLQRYIALCGVTSRRKAEELILAGRIKVNGKPVRELGTKVEPGLDRVEFDNRLIEEEGKKIYIALNKPLGYVTTLDDEFNRKIVTDLTKEIEERIYPVGRLDMDTSGLLIMTNDGEVTNKLTHPRYEVEKTYLAKVYGVPNSTSIEKFEKGLLIDGEKTAPASLKVTDITRDNDALLEIKIHEGKNRQVRKMCDAIGHSVIDLKRNRIGKINLGDLKLGKWRYLNDTEIRYLKNIR